MVDKLLSNLEEIGKKLNSYLDITQEQINDAIKDFRKEQKSDWEEIAEWGCNAAKEAGFTEEDSRALLKEIRDSLNNL